MTEEETFLCPRFILFILFSSSFPMVFDLTRGNLDRIDNRWKHSLCKSYFMWIVSWIKLSPYEVGGARGGLGH